MREYQHLSVVKEGAIDWLTLNRPAQFNAFDFSLAYELQHYLRGLERDGSVRVVVLRGAGKHFCAGMDLKEALGSDVGGGVERALERQRSIGDVMVLLRRIPQPVIALVQGAASGAGFALMLAADVRYAARGARMNVAMARIGLTGCDIGISYHLTRSLGASVASELMLTGRFIDAERAERLGLVSGVVDEFELEATGRALAQEMLAVAPTGLRLTKECIRFALDAPSLEAVVAMEDRQQVVCTSTADYREGVSAFLERRPPRFGSAS